MRLVALVSLAFLVGCAAQQAEVATTQSDRVTQDTCESPWDGGARAQRLGLAMKELKGEQKDTLVANYNASEPPTDYDPDHVYVFGKSGLSFVLLVMTKDNCVLETAKVPVENFAELLEPPGKSS